MRTGCAMAVMGKASFPGRTKTRLVPPLSPEQAAHLNTAFLQDILCNMRQAARAAAIEPYIAFTPTGSEPFFRGLSPEPPALIECSLPDFGDCLFKAVRIMLEKGHGAACVVNADSPTLPTAYLVKAARALAAPGDRLVIGPSADGGYYFLGLKQPHRRLFESIDWSTPRVFQQTLERAAELALPVMMLERWYDVDDAEALQLLTRDLAQATSYDTPQNACYAAPHTRGMLTRIARNTDGTQSVSETSASDLFAVPG